MGTRLAPQVEQVLEAGGGDERRPSPLSLQERVRGDSRPVCEALELAGADSSRRGEHALLLTGRCRHLCSRDPSVRDEDCVREGAAHVDAEDRHGATLLRIDAVDDAFELIGMTARSGRGAPVELKLVGAGGEAVDLRRTIASHGVADLPPNRIDEEAWTLELTLPLDGRTPRTVRVSAGRAGHARLDVLGRPPGAAGLDQLRSAVAHVLRLDEDLTPFYEVAAADADLAWATAGGGRMLRSPTVFEEVVKTICTTNCTWSATVRMVGALVEHLGEPAAGSPPDGPFGRAFPNPEAMAPADELAARLLALPGVGPYAAAHVMMLLGRYSRLILDSWTRPKYLRVSGAKRAKDSTIERRFRRHGPYAGLAFWLYLTRDWIDD